MDIPLLIRLITIITTFSYASYKDITTRKIPSKIWIPGNIIGILLLLYKGRYIININRSVLIFILLLILLLSLLFINIPIGNADIKAIITILIILPYPINSIPLLTDTVLPIPPFISVFFWASLTATIYVFLYLTVINIVDFKQNRKKIPSLNRQIQSDEILDFPHYICIKIDDKELETPIPTDLLIDLNKTIDTNIEKITTDDVESFKQEYPIWETYENLTEKIPKIIASKKITIKYEFPLVAFLGAGTIFTILFGDMLMLIFVLF